MRILIIICFIKKPEYNLSKDTGMLVVRTNIWIQCAGSIAHYPYHAASFTARALSTVICNLSLPLEYKLIEGRYILFFFVFQAVIIDYSAYTHI